MAVPIGLSKQIDPFLGRLPPSFFAKCQVTDHQGAKRDLFALRQNVALPPVLGFANPGRLRRRIPETEATTAP
ncbi:hypothetical protein [Ensifer canadensis]